LRFRRGLHQIRAFKAFSSLPEDTYESLLSVPLISGGQVIGVINVHHKNVRLHSAEEVALLSYVAEQMGGAIARARLMEQSRSASRKVEIPCGRRRYDLRRRLSGSNPSGDF
jgi:GAF domain-containing protein